VAYSIKGDLHVGRRVEAGTAIRMSPWQIGASYLVGDLYMFGGDVYVATANHVSAVSPNADGSSQLLGGEGKPHVFVLSTDIPSAVVGAPTAAEVKAWNDALVTPNADRLIYLTDNDLPSGTVTKVFSVDLSQQVLAVTGQESLAISVDGNTYLQSTNGIIDFVVDGNPVGDVVWDYDLGMPKWTLMGGLDPSYYAGTPQTIAQRDALVATNPMTKRGWLVYVVDTGVEQYQVWNGMNWVPVGGSANKTIQALVIASRNTINPLAFLPLSPVEFSVNGVAATSGITNTGTAVSVDPIALGFNIDPGLDVVTAQYLY